MFTAAEKTQRPDRRWPTSVNAVGSDSWTRVTLSGRLGRLFDLRMSSSIIIYENGKFRVCERKDIRPLSMKEVMERKRRSGRLMQ